REARHATGPPVAGSSPQDRAFARGLQADGAASGRAREGRREQTAGVEEADDRGGVVVGRAGRRGEVEVGRFGRLVGGVDAAEAGDLTGAGAAVEALGIARLADRERGVDEDLEEAPRGQALAHAGPVVAV